MVDSFVKNEDIAVRKFIVSSSAVSYAIIFRFVHAHVFGVSVYDAIHWQLTKYSLQSIKDGRMIRMIHYMSWPDHGVPKNVDDIVKILYEVEDSQRAVEGKKGPVIVMCR